MLGLLNRSAIRLDRSIRRGHVRGNCTNPLGGDYVETRE